MQSESKQKVLHILPEGWGNGGVQKIVITICEKLKNKYSFYALKFTRDTRFFDKLKLQLQVQRFV